MFKQTHKIESNENTPHFTERVPILPVGYVEITCNQRIISQ